MIMTQWQRHSRLGALVWLMCFVHTSAHPSVLGGSKKTGENHQNGHVDKDHAAHKPVSADESNRLHPFDGRVFLERFGYLDLLPDHKHSPKVLSAAIREYQRFLGLKETGRLDAETITNMKLPRCAVPDRLRPGDRSKENVKLSEYRVFDYKWVSPHLTYKVLGYTEELTREDQLLAYSNAFKLWSDVSPLTFELVTEGPADIEITFGTQNHGDGTSAAFDGPLGVLAHAYPPSEDPRTGDVHFDGEEQWTLDLMEGINLEKVAAHEFGHVLGLDHSSSETALMYPVLYEFQDISLDTDDIRGIQAIYGKKEDSEPTMRIATRSIKPLTVKTMTNDIDNDRCPQKFDALEKVHDGNVYAFLGDTLYTVTSSGPSNVTKIDSLYAGSPHSPGAVVYDRFTDHVYMFKGNKYWRYTGYTKDTGYPRSLPIGFHNVTAALQIGRGMIYLFKDSTFVVWNEDVTKNSPGYSPVIKTVWKGLPGNIDAAFRGNNGNYYFFKDQKFWSFGSSGLLTEGFPKSIEPAWLGCRHNVKVNKEIPNSDFSTVFL